MSAQHTPVFGTPERLRGWADDASVGRPIWGARADLQAAADDLTALTEQRDELLAALEAMDALVENLWKSVPWGRTCGLDIAALNRVPPMAKRAIAKARGAV